MHYSKKIKQTFLFVLLQLNFLHAEEFSFQLNTGDEIKVFSRKKNIYQYEGNKVIEAIGNVVIVHKGNTLYGDSARFSFAEKLFSMKGNVRLVGEDMTLYGESLVYQTESKQFVLKNAKLFSPRYSISARTIERTDEQHYISKEAEFSTCKDCPESWSLYADEIDVTINEYIKTKKALLKLKGIDFFYVPYFIFPIKKTRQTGLLFPSFKSRFNQGLVIEQPIYLALSNEQDATLTSSFATRRGYGADLQYRNNFSYNSWFEQNFYFLNDRIYLPSKENDEKSNTSFSRYYHDLDLGYRPSERLNFHVFFSDVRDLDFARDFETKLAPKIFAPNTGLDVQLNKTLPAAELSAMAYLPNTLVKKDEDREKDIFSQDPTSVRLLPELRLTSRQYSLSRNGAFLSDVLWNVDSQFDQFTQNKFLSTDSTLRNAQRTIIDPKLTVNWWKGDYFTLNQTINHQWSNYNFRAVGEKDFHKYQAKSVSKLSVQFEKTYGVASVDEMMEPQVEQNSELEKSQLYLGTMPRFRKKGDLNTTKVTKYAYRHLEEFALLHYYLFQEKWSGNQKFYDQVQQTSGWFDDKDAFRKATYTDADSQYETQIPVINTLELQWNNSLVRKTPKKIDFKKDYSYLKDQFDFSRMLYFNVSQGIKLNEYDHGVNYKDALTRLKLMMGWSITNHWDLTATDYYFHKNSNQVLDLTINGQWTWFLMSHSLAYNDINLRKDWTAKYKWLVNDEISLSYSSLKDLNTQSYLRQVYGVDFYSMSKCWMIGLSYAKTISEEQIGFDFAFNLGAPNYGGNMTNL
jgi:LPS-assembly protein